MDERTKKGLKWIKHYQENIETISKRLIEREAREILRKHPALVEFVMAMGTCMFKDKHNVIVDLEGKQYLKEFSELVGELNDACMVCGNPMRFTVDGPVVTDW